MPLDAICLSALIHELAPALEGARIDKVQQPERDLLLLSLFTKEGNRRLLISANVGAARLHFTNEKIENPDSPPMFCMLLRKHLSGARICSVSQPDFERVAILEISCRDELGVETKKLLVAELMGRSSNIILVDSDGRIIDCMRRIDFGEEAVRRLLPGMIYHLPPKQKKQCFFELSARERRAAWESASGDTASDIWLAESFSGLSPLIAREISHRAQFWERLPVAMEALADSVAAGEIAPFMLNEDGAAKDYSFMQIKQYGDKVICEEYSDFSSLLDAFYARRDKAERMRRISSETYKAVKTLRDRQARKLSQQRQELADTAGREELRRKGDLITANIWRMKKGDRMLEAEDYFSDNGQNVQIPLDTMKTPQQNAAALYKEYKKSAAAEKHLTALLDEGERRLDYLDSVLDELSRAESERDVADIRHELMSAGIFKPKKNSRPQKTKMQGPLRFITTSGFEVLIGRSNIQNDELVLKTAHRTDIWLHTQQAHGSHAIIRTRGESPDEAALAEAAVLAAFYSQARGAGKVPVDYTEARNVRKPAGAMPGMVLYTRYKTIIAQPDEALVMKLKA